MFTGLIQDVGTLLAVAREGQSVHLQVQTELAPLLADGDSLAVNGVCLTVTSTGDRLAVATAIPETLKRTNLGLLRVGQQVNLEPALRLGDRLGGHLVQGHVDGMGSLARRQQRGISLELTLEAPPQVLRYIVHKGSITIDGVSLTVAALEQTTFSVALVPHTLGQTTLQELAVGRRVNLEVDILAKYVERLLGRGEQDAEQDGGISEAWLRQHGF